MSWLSPLLDVFLRLDAHLQAWSTSLGPWFYAVLFAVVFCETGLIVLPLLPGDSLLFAIGALASRAESGLSLPAILLVLSLAAIAGDSLSYAIGRRLQPRLIASKRTFLFKPETLARTHVFFEKHGGKALIFARFLPVIRAFAPFVAGVSQMSYARFAMYNVIGGLLWVGSLAGGGYVFADLPVVKDHFHYVLLAVVLVSLSPAAIELLNARRLRRKRRTRMLLLGER